MSAAENSSETLADYVRQLLDLLETVEESDGGREFHPTTIQTCRCLHAEKIDEIMPKITELCRRQNTEEGNFE